MQTYHNTFDLIVSDDYPVNPARPAMLFCLARNVIRENGEALKYSRHNRRPLPAIRESDILGIMQEPEFDRANALDVTVGIGMAIRRAKEVAAQGAEPKRSILVTERERDTILAALRLWQAHLGLKRVTGEQTQVLADIAENGREGDDAALSIAEIESLILGRISR